MTLASRNRYREFSRKILVLTNDPNHRTEQLECTGRVKVPFHLEPQALTFGQLSREEKTHTRTMTITRGDGGPISPELVGGQQEGISISLRTIEEGEKYELTTDIAIPQAKGSLRRSLVLRTGVSEAPTTSIPLYADVVPRLTTRPTRLTIIRDADKARSFPLTLAWDKLPAGDVTGASVNDPELKARVEKRGSAQLVYVDVPANYAPQPGSKWLTIQTVDSEASSIRVPIVVQNPRPTAQANASRAISAAPARQQKSIDDEAKKAALETKAPGPQPVRHSLASRRPQTQTAATPDAGKN